MFGEGDRATAGGETQTTASSREVFPRISYNACPETERTGWTLSAAYVSRWSIERLQIRSDCKIVHSTVKLFPCFSRTAVHTLGISPIGNLRFLQRPRLNVLENNLVKILIKHILWVFRIKKSTVRALRYTVLGVKPKTILNWENMLFQATPTK